jgi:hypothetical protein
MVSHASGLLDAAITGDLDTVQRLLKGTSALSLSLLSASGLCPLLGDLYPLLSATCLLSSCRLLFCLCSLPVLSYL